MMKKICLIFFFLLLTYGLFSKDVYELFPSDQIILDGNKIEYSRYGEGFSSEYVIIKKGRFKYLCTNNKFDFLFLKSDDWIYLLSVGSKFDIIYGSRTNPGNGPYTDVDHILFSNITASAYLLERYKNTVIEYPPSNLLDWDIQSCWAISLATKETIVLSLYANEGETFESFYVYNGYINANSPELFIDNARAKDIEITTDGKDVIAFTLEDTPECQSVYLNKKTNMVKIIIKSVYEGEKYNDLVIAGVFASRKGYEF